MTLLDKITAATAAADAGTLHPSSKQPFILNRDAALSSVSPVTDDSNHSSLVQRVTGWNISSTNSNLADISARFAAAISDGLRRPKRPITRPELLAILISFLSDSAESAGVSVGLERSDPMFARTALDRYPFLITKEAARFLAEACVTTKSWEILEILIDHKLFDQFTSIGLIERLVEKNCTKLLCLCAHRLSDLRATELLLILKFFLSPNERSYDDMIEIRKEWETKCLLAVEKTVQKGIPKEVVYLAKNAAILLMIGHDGFKSPEICLHFLFGSQNLDSFILSSAISQLNGSEVLGLVKYLLKWLEKYQNFPEAVNCTNTEKLLGIKLCDVVPSFKAVVEGMGLVLDEHYSYLALSSEFRDQMSVLEKTVSYLASEAESSHRVNDVIGRLLSNRRDH